MTTPTIAIAVVSHHSRREAAWNLIDAIGRPAALFEDPGDLGCEANHQRAWDWCTQKRDTADWFIVLEDDAQPIDDFRAQATAALTAAPTPIVSFYLGTGYPPGWQQRIARALAGLSDSTPWLLADTLLHAVGVAIRSDLLHQLDIPDGYAIDNAIGRWARKHDHLIAYSVPSLVDHADGEPVIAKRHDRLTREKPRKAWRTGARAAWTGRAAPL